ncbi:MAG: acyltransferase domain-containing protein, partial [Deltaproteobacteria bacterium]
MDKTPIVLGISPFEGPDVPLVEALLSAGAWGILDLGRDPARAEQALSQLARRGRPFGVRVPEGVAVPPLPAEVETVVLPAGVDLAPLAGRRRLVEVCTVAEAEAALAAGAEGLVAKGSESGGRVGEESAFVLLQHLRRHTDRPIYLRGGIGLHTAAAAVAGGASGVVLSEQLALAKESQLSQAVKDAVSRMDGSETAVLRGYRVYVRPDLSISALAETLPFSQGPAIPQKLLPCGQEAAFARSLAERFGTVGGIVGAIERSIASHLRQAQTLLPLAPGRGVAAVHGMRYPIVQGPMTRVSDRAEFAAQVARAGALPMLALSLLREGEVRRLLEETRERLGGMPWGVGILGFVPEALRAEQLRVIEEVRPPVALIAGGRPAQARSLEKLGIPTFLHVPSPGLLDLFLKDGARRFVFEGRECGGHVGPRSSFSLWEAQVERLLDFEAPEELEVLFAGGIHDARSAAMVAALAAPLAARGAKLGVLMGTAYLFTEEAVEAGAISQVFQEAALRATETRLLETSPGHATRCVDSEYVRHFEEMRRRLEAEGKTQEEIWQALEDLNLGRLRIAAKGLRRDGSRLVEVDEQTQRREGMFMIGQVAALRDAVTTLAELHESVSEGSTRRLQEMAVPERRRPRPPPARVAIVGMASFFPGARDVHAFWRNVVLGVNSVTEVSPERWNPEIYFDPESQDGTKTPSKWGGFLDEIDFDPLDYGIPPKSLAAVEPVQLLALECARQALADAGYEARDFDRERASVIFGAEAGTDLASGYGFRALWPGLIGELPPELDAVLPKLTEDSFPGVLANVIAGRIANRLDLGGVNYTVDAACASSLAAVDLACKELRSGSSDLVLCGGADLHNAIGDYLLFASTHALSRKGRCAPFDAEADGIALGEGVAVLVLKRLEDAERDGDRIYAVIEGVAGSSDGRFLGLTAPRKEGQIRALLRAYERGGVDPREVGLIEAHGTGTVVGDRTELGTLTEVFRAAGAEPGTVTLGSVKSNIGHTKCAAGLAGLIKAALALYHRVLPPTLHIERPNPAWDPESSPFVFRKEAAPWWEKRRLAGVSAFGFGGTNFHAVLSAYGEGETPSVGISDWPAELFLFSSEKEVEAMLRVVEKGQPWRLRDLAASLPREGEVVLSVVATDLEDLAAKLRAAERGEELPGVYRRAGDPGKVAVLFPGQGAQRPGMLGGLFVAFPELVSLLELGSKWAPLIYPPAAWDPETAKRQRAALTDTRVAQPALGIVDLAAWRLLSRILGQVDMLAGHSYGELVALAAAGAVSPSDLLVLSERRGEAILEAAGGRPGIMAAVAAAETAVREVLGEMDGVVVANLNAPTQTVIAGTEVAVEEACRRLQAQGIGAKRLNVACAFHSPLVASAAERLAEYLQDLTVTVPEREVWSNTLAAPYPKDADAVRRLLAEHVARPVRFVEEIEAMYEAGARTFVECGPGRTLSDLTRKILGEKPHLALALEEPGKDFLSALVDRVARLAAAGVPVDTSVLFEGRETRPIDLDAPPVLRRPSAWRVNGHLARPWQGELPDFALHPVREPLTLSVGGGPRVGEGSDSVMIEYLRSVREMAEAQREVMLAWMGQAPAAQRTVPVDRGEVAAAEIVPR